MKFLVVDDHELVRDGFAAVLSGIYPDLQLVQAGSVAEGRDAIRGDHDFDLAILDMKLPDGEGIELMDELETYHPEVPMIAVSADYSFQERALNRGALGFLPKEAESSDILEAIAAVLSGKVYLPNTLHSSDIGSRRALQRRSDAQTDSQLLSNKQKAVLRLVMQGRSNRDIAKELGLAESTIKAYVSDLLRMFKVSNRTQAVLLAKDLDLLGDSAKSETGKASKT